MVRREVKLEVIMERYSKVLLITTDNHTLGIQTVANIIHKRLNILPVIFYLPSSLSEYPSGIESKIMDRVRWEIDESDDEILIGFHLKELSMGRSIQLANNIKQLRGGEVRVVAGGTYATVEPASLLSIFDHVVVGSGEGILEILESKSAKPIVMVQPTGLEYPIFTDCWILDEYGEITKRRLRPFIHPQYKSAKALEIMLGVGCAYSCSYCEVASLRGIFGDRYRISFAGPELAIGLIKRETDLNTEIQYIYFFDEDFLLKPVRWIETFTSLYQKGIGLPFFIFATPSSVDKFPHKLIALSKAGLDTVNMGIQSGSEATARGLFGRKEDKDGVISCVEFLIKLHLEGEVTSPPMFDFIILNPYETVRDVLETIQLIIELPTPFRAIIHCMSFFRGTPLYDKATNDGIIAKDYRFGYDLHDFIGRIKDNELNLDYSREEIVNWLFLNVLLYGMRGLHRKIDGERLFGNLSTERLNELMYHTRLTYQDVISLAESFPNPIDDIQQPWERVCEDISEDEARCARPCV